MKTVEILSDFDAYPNDRDKRRFTAGEEPELSDKFADLLIAKELAREKPTGGKPASPPFAQKPAADAGDKKETDK